MSHDPATPSHKWNAYIGSTQDINEKVHNSKKLENTQMSPNSKMDKHSMANPNNWKLYRNENTETTAILSNMAESHQKMLSKRGRMQQSISCTIPKLVSMVIKVLTVATFGRNSNWEGQKGSCQHSYPKEFTSRQHIKLAT